MEISIAGGVRWSWFAIYEYQSPEYDKLLGDIVLQRFYELAASKGYDVTVYPQTSQVFLTADELPELEERWNIEESLEDLMDQAEDETWQAFCGFDNPVSEILKNAMEEQCS
jgi:hypothetical protein